jgi:desulfoferrodoxin-like iron-binding protein
LFCQRKTWAALNRIKGIGGNVTSKVGKRYVCDKCGAEYIVTRAGKGDLKCCGQPMKEKGK